MWLGSTRGAMAMDGIPDDIVARLRGRVAEGRWPGADEWTCRVRRDDSTLQYREPVRRESRVVIELVGTREERVEQFDLDFHEPGRVRYVVRFPRARNVGLVLGAFGGGIHLVVGLLERAQVFVILAACVFVALATAVMGDERRKARRVIQLVLAAEIADARGELNR